LVGLLWCLALLSVIVIGVLHTARMDLLVVKNYGDRIQAHYLALAGIEKTRALLYRDARDRSRTQKNHTGNYYNNEQEFRDIAFGRGTFRIMHRAGPDDGGGILFGVSDEESRLNVNTATADELAKLPNLSPAVASAIVNWRGGDTNTDAAETQYYAGLQPPYQPRLGAFQTVRELLMVRGVTPQDLLGRDARQNGLLTPAEGNDFAYPNAVESDDLGWAACLTVDSTVQDVNAAGENRVNIKTADEHTLAGIHGLNPRIAHAVVTYRGQHQFQSIADLLNVTPPQAQGRFGGDNSSSSQVISEDLFLEIADDVTTADNQNLTGVININTAGVDVLACLPGMTRELAQAVVAHRQAGEYFANIGELLKLPDMTRDLFQQIAPLITARSETYRLLSEGRINSTGTRQRIQAIVQVGLNHQQILAWREDNL
jgi:general secretion pathway protein K